MNLRAGLQCLLLTPSTVVFVHQDLTWGSVPLSPVTSCLCLTHSIPSPHRLGCGVVMFGHQFAVNIRIWSDRFFCSMMDVRSEPIAFKGYKVRVFPQQPSSKVKTSPSPADLLQTDRAVVLFGEADVIDARGELRGLKADDCGAAAHLSAPVTVAQPCHVAQKLLSPDKRACRGRRTKSIFSVLKKLQVSGPE